MKKLTTWTFLFSKREEYAVRSKEKYYKLQNYFSNANEPVLLMSFSEIEQILGFRLSTSAYQYPAVWSNSYSHSLAAAWLRAGYRSEQLSLERQTIVFRKAENSKNKTSGIVRCRLKKDIPQMAPDTAVRLITDYFNETVKDEHGRYMSWRHCYNICLLYTSRCV